MNIYKFFRGRTVKYSFSFAAVKRFNHVIILSQYDNLVKRSYAPKNKALWEHLKQNLKDFEIQAGWFENSKYDDGTPIAKIAAVQNYGAHINQVITDKQRAFLHYIGIHLKKATKELNIVIPARPFMNNAKKRVQGEEGKKILLQEFLRVFEGRQTMEQAADRLSKWLQGIIQEEIKAITTPPLKSGTIRARASSYVTKKGASDKPLADTGIMLATVQSKVITK